MERRGGRLVQNEGVGVGVGVRLLGVRWGWGVGVNWEWELDAGGDRGLGFSVYRIQGQGAVGDFTIKLIKKEKYIYSLLPFCHSCRQCFQLG